MVKNELLSDVYCITSHWVSLARKVDYKITRILFVSCGYDSDYKPAVPLGFVGMQVEFEY